MAAGLEPACLSRCVVNSGVDLIGCAGLLCPAGASRHTQGLRPMELTLPWSSRAH